MDLFFPILLTALVSIFINLILSFVNYKLPLIYNNR